MKAITFNRVEIVVVLAYSTIAALGVTGSFWRALQTLGLLLVVLHLGILEGLQQRLTTAEAGNQEGGA
jgi:uncharacterized membrane protein